MVSCCIFTCSFLLYPEQLHVFFLPKTCCDKRRFSCHGFRPFLPPAVVLCHFNSTNNLHMYFFANSTSAKDELKYTLVPPPQIVFLPEFCPSLHKSESTILSSSESHRPRPIFLITHHHFSF